jgi:hypothetical protein
MKASVHVSLLSVFLVGCSAVHNRLSSSADSTGGVPTVEVHHQQDESKTERYQASIPVSQRFEKGALVLDIQEVQLTPSQISIYVEIKNQSNQLIRFYPNQGSLSTGLDELKANIFLSDDELSGVLDPQERKSGVLVFSSRFEQEIDVQNIRSLRLSLGQVIDMASIEPKVVDFAFSLEPTSYSN